MPYNKPGMTGRQTGEQYTHSLPHNINTAAAAAAAAGLNCAQQHHHHQLFFVSTI